MAVHPELDAIQDAVLEWYAREGRSFEWRETDDPYAILVLEVMSQQTQLERVEAAWRAFVDRWPTPDALAEASTGEVIAFWSEHRLGYNRRAEYLARAATHIVEAWDGQLPTSASELQDLHGVGPYTANAVTSFAFDEPNAVVDTNVRRVYNRLVEPAEDLESIANAFLPEDEAGRWNNAIMDLGATVCTSTPRCDDEPCPMRKWCVAYQVDSFDYDSGSTQKPFRGSRRQYRGRIVREVASNGPLEIDDLGHRVHEAYRESPDVDREWLDSLLGDLVEEGLVSIDTAAGTVRLPEE